MKFIIILFLLLANNSFTQGIVDDSLFAVERWWIVDFGINMGKKQIIEKRVFNNRNKLLSYIEISKGACNTIDSVVFNYNKNDYLIERVEYLPTDSLINECQSYLKEEDRTKLSLIDSRKIKKNYVKKSNLLNNFNRKLMIEDSLGLLEKELSEIELVICGSKEIESNQLRSLNSVITKKKFISNFRPSILTQYGITTDAFLRYMIVYLQENRLISDEFHFQNITLKRDYKYIGGYLKEINIYVKGRGANNIYLEGFDYSKVSGK